MHIRIPYTKPNDLGFTYQDLFGDHTTDGVEVTLNCYGGVLPLVPGDVLAITGQDESGVFTATDVVSTRDCWLIEVHFRCPEGGDEFDWAAARLAADAGALELSDQADVDRPSAFTVQVATDDNTWLLSFIRSNPAVHSYGLVRWPGYVLDLDAERDAPGMEEHAILTPEGQEL